MRRVLIATAAVLAAVLFFALATLPPLPQTVGTSGIDADLIRRTIRGAYHVHTSRSDGASDKAAIAAAAARARLTFVIFTDHGDGTAPPDPAVYIAGVLCIDGIEISTNGGHYVALGMRQAPYPLGGDPAAVVEDVARLGGFGVAAHPDSPKPSLRWTDWDAPVDGLEWLSADSEWRDESRGTLARVLFAYVIRPGPALAWMLDRPVATLKRWDDLARHRPIVALAAHDAHGGIGRGVEESGARKRTPRSVPSYEASFRSFSDNVIVDAPLSGDAGVDARRVLDAVRQGRVFTVIDAVAAPGVVDIRRAPGSVSIKATLPDGAELVTIADGREGAHHGTTELSIPVDSATHAIRLEARVPGAPGTPPVPWLLTNPIFFSASPPVRPADAAPRETVPFPPDLPWHVEKDPRSTAALEAGPHAAALRYTLAPGARSSQFAALVAGMASSLPAFKRVVFSGSADHPTRVSVQLRYAPGGGERWGSSVYLDPTARDIVVFVDRMRPLDRQAGAAPVPTSASSLLFVTDLTNATPGTSNVVRISNLRFAR